jgi:uncharacterized membrane protein (UPF0127 family)
MRLTKIYFFIVLLCSLLAVSCSKNSATIIEPAANYNFKLQVGQKILLVELADTDSKKSAGLSDRQTMPLDAGMLFVFEPESTPKFWMKNMNFDLDLIWINKNKIVGITPNVPAPAAGKTKPQNLPLHSPPLKVDQVLEVNAGWAEKNNIKVGDDIAQLKN